MLEVVQLTLIGVFPQFIGNWAEYGMARRAVRDGLVQVNQVDLRDFGVGRHKKIDDAPFGGGPGLILRYDVLHAALEHAVERYGEGHVVLLDAGGEKFSQQMAEAWVSEHRHVIFIAGRYEGIDARIYSHVDAIVSLGQFILTGGEAAAVVMADAMIRFIPGVLGNSASHAEDSHGGHIIEHRQYTKPVHHLGLAVPDVLRSGDHAAIEDARSEDRVLRSQHPKTFFDQNHQSGLPVKIEGESS